MRINPAVRADLRGKGVGRALVADSLAQVAPCGFASMQFNAVVDSNKAALHLHESLGMQRIGTIPGGFRNGDGEDEDMHIFFWRP